MKNWKTTIGGLLLSIGILLQPSQDNTIKTIGFVLSTAGSLILGLTAKDYNVIGGSK